MAQPQPQPDIEMAPPQYNNNVPTNPNEKQNLNIVPPSQVQGPHSPIIHYGSSTPLASLQEKPQPVDCPVCGVREITLCEYHSGGATHLLAVLLCCFACCLAPIPYFASGCKDCEHRCGNCRTLLAVWHRSGRTEVMAHNTNAASRGTMNALPQSTTLN